MGSAASISEISRLTASVLYLSLISHAAAEIVICATRSISANSINSRCLLL